LKISAVPDAVSCWKYYVQVFSLLLFSCGRPIKLWSLFVSNCNVGPFWWCVLVCSFGP